MSKDDRLVRLDKDTYSAVEQLANYAGIHKAEIISKAITVFLVYLKESENNAQAEQDKPRIIT